MTYSFWDMDHTLINNDCDVSWKEFLIQKGLAAPDQMALVDEFYRQYAAGKLAVDEFMAFQLQEFSGRTPQQIRALCKEHFNTVVKPKIYPQALQMVRDQQASGWNLILLTATNLEIAFPLAEYFGFPQIIASELEMADGIFTGRPSGVYCCGEGKLERLKMYCGAKEINLADVHYYGDSLSDIYVLQAVGHPHAVNPMPKLREMAEQNGWDILTFNMDR